MTTSSQPIIIVGAGLAALGAAIEIEAAGESCLLLESAAHVGGKLETTVFKDSYRLDRGFQVLLPAYPELQRLGDLTTELELCYFNSGARLETPVGSVTIANPLTQPRHLFSTAFGSYATLRDKYLVMKLQWEVHNTPIDALLASATGTTLDYLRAYGFSERMISHFWLPFFSGIFLEAELSTAAGFFRYLFRMFASSPVAVPRFGVGELPKLMAKKLKRSEIRLKANVAKISGNTVELSDGQKIEARAVLNKSGDKGPFGQVTSFWFSADEPPFEGPWLSLNSRAVKPLRLINHVAVLSNVSRDYALKGDALICVNVLGLSVDPKRVMEEALTTYGTSVKSWSLLRTDEIKRAFPLYQNRTDINTPSQQGAIARGRAAARTLLTNTLGHSL